MADEATVGFAVDLRKAFRSGGIRWKPMPKSRKRRRHVRRQMAMAFHARLRDEPPTVAMRVEERDGFSCLICTLADGSEALTILSMSYGVAVNDSRQRIALSVVD